MWSDLLFQLNYYLLCGPLFDLFDVVPREWHARGTRGIDLSFTMWFNLLFQLIIYLLCVSHLSHSGGWSPPWLNRA